MCYIRNRRILTRVYFVVVNDSNSEEIEDDGGSLSYETESVADYTDEDDTKQAEKSQFIHITDTHGWVFGHPHDERYNTDFGDFVSLMEKIDSKYILFGTDDVVYYDSVSFAVIDAAFEKFPHDIFGFSLRLSPQGLADGK